MHTDNTNTSLKLNKYLITEIDGVRGNQSRQAFIKMILTQHFKEISDDKTSNHNK